MKRLLAYTGVGLLGLLLAAGGMAAWMWQQRDDILRRELTNMLRAQVQFGVARYDLWTHYPVIEVITYGLALESTNPRFSQRPFEMDSARLRLNLIDLITNQEEKYIQRIDLWGVAVEQYNDSAFTANFRIFAPVDSNRQGPRQTVIDTLILHNTSLHYHAMLPGREYWHQFDSLALHLEITRPQVALTVAAQGRTHYWREGDFAFLENRPFTVVLKGAVHKFKQALMIAESELNLNGAIFNVQGEMPVSRNQYYDLRFQVPEGSIEALLNLMPEVAGAQIRKFQPQGRFAFQGLVSGQVADGQNPHIELKFQAEEAAFQTNVRNLDFTNLNLSGIYSNGEGNNVASTYLELDHLNGSLNGHPVYARLRLDQLQLDPYINLEARARVHIDELRSLVPLELSAQPQGEVDLHLRAAGYVRHLSNFQTLDELTYSGSVSLHNVDLAPAALPLELEALNGQVFFGNDTLRLDSISGRLNEQAIFVDGLLPNFFPYIFKNEEVLNAAITLRLDGFDLVDVWANFQGLAQYAALKSRQRAEIRAIENGPRPHWLNFRAPDRLNLDLRLVGSNLSLRYARFDSLDLQMQFRDRYVNVPRFILWNTNTEMTGTLSLDSRNDTLNEARANFSFNSLSLQELLSQTGLSENPDTLTPGQAATQVGAKLDIYSLSAYRAHDTLPPLLNAEVRFTDGYVRRPNGQPSLEQIGWVLKLDESIVAHPRTTGLMIDSIAGLLNSYPFHARIGLDNLTDRTLTVQMGTALPLETVTRLVSMPSVTEPAGTLTYTGTMMGPLRRFFHRDSILLLETAGEMGLVGVAARVGHRRMPLHGFYANIGFNEHGTFIRHLSGYVGSTDLRINGQAQEWVSFLLGKQDTLIGQLNIHSDTLNLTELLAADAERPDSGLRFGLPLASRLSISYSVGHVMAGRFQADSLLLLTRIRNRVATLRRLRGRFAGGWIDAIGRVDATDTAAIAVNMDVDLRGVQFQQTLATFNDFNQTLLTSENARGTLYGHLLYHDTLPPSLVPSFVHTRATISVDVRDGQLAHFAPLGRLRTFYSRHSLDTVQFTMVAPALQWENQRLTIPDLRIYSTIFDIIAEGTHTLDNQMDYRLRVAPIRGHRPLFDSSVQRLLYGPARISPIALSITGHAKHPLIKYDFLRGSRQLLYRMLW